MKQTVLKGMPRSFERCIQADCPLAGQCLRQLAMQTLTKTDAVVAIVNPLLTKPSEQCEFYRNASLQVFARGFAGMKEQMLPAQYSIFMKRLQARFGRSAYFDRRNGRRLCSPADIEFIRKVLKELGLEGLEFDEYVEQNNWNS